MKNFRILIVILSVVKAFATQNTSTIAGILDTCYSFLESHLCQGEKWKLPFHFYRPSIEKYSADQVYLLLIY